MQENSQLHLKEREPWEPYSSSQIMQAGKSSRAGAKSLPGLFLTFCLHVLPLGSFPDIDSEHHDFGSHGGHPVAKAELVSSIHVGSKGVFSTGLSVAFINPFVIGPCDLRGENRGSQVFTSNTEVSKGTITALPAHSAASHSQARTPAVIWLLWHTSIFPSHYSLAQSRAQKSFFKKPHKLLGIESHTKASLPGLLRSR